MQDRTLTKMRILVVVIFLCYLRLGAMYVLADAPAGMSAFQTWDESIQGITTKAYGGIVQVIARTSQSGKGSVTEKNDRNEELRPTVLQFAGSGFAFSEPGYFITAAGLAGEGREFELLFTDGSRDRAELVGVDSYTHIAVLRSSKLQLQPLAIRSTPVKAGMWLMVAGFSTAGITTIAQGLCSLIPGSVGETSDIFAVSALHYDGNVGSAVLDGDGNLVGMIFDEVNEQESGAGVQMLLGDHDELVNHRIAMGRHDIPGEILSVSWIQWVFEQIKTHQRVERGWMGVTAEEQEQSDGATAIILKRVTKDSPAERAGLLKGDIITEFGGRTIKDVSEWIKLIQQTPPQTSVTVNLVRNGEKKQVEVTLDRMDNNPSSQQLNIKTDYGFSIQDLSPDLAKYFSIAPNSGVLVAEVEPGSNAERIGLKAGDIITKLDAHPVKNGEDFVHRMKMVKKDSVIFSLTAADREFQVNFSFKNPTAP